MLYPKGFRRNARYRGPIESDKINSRTTEMQLNLKELRTAIEAQEVVLSAIRKNIQSADAQECRNRISIMNDAAEQINGGTLNGY